MSLTTVPTRIRLLLWGKAAGRCEYEGCNEPLWVDRLTKAEFNVAYIAHIVADKPEGPRGHPMLSNQLKADISNLMLACDRHHRLIDLEQVDQHPIERLQAMKRRHEERIELVGSLTSEKQSHVLLYGANIGVHSAVLSMRSTAEAMLPEWYPADVHPLDVGLKNSSIVDRDADYWRLEEAQLERVVRQQLYPRLAQGNIGHLSVFALAPQPLLIKLGSLLSDIPAVEVYQLHREPRTWKWQEVAQYPEYRFLPPARVAGPPALAISLSATIADERIHALLPNASIWKVSIEAPHNDVLQARQQLRDFRVLMRRLMDQIKVHHGQGEMIHIFPAMPVSAAVELGRIRMPKADLPFAIYDENREAGGFQLALTIGRN